MPCKVIFEKSAEGVLLQYNFEDHEAGGRDLHKKLKAVGISPRLFLGNEKFHPAAFMFLPHEKFSKLAAGFGSDVRLAGMNSMERYEISFDHFAKVFQTTGFYKGERQDSAHDINGAARFNKKSREAMSQPSGKEIGSDLALLDKKIKTFTYAEREKIMTKNIQKRQQAGDKLDQMTRDLQGREGLTYAEAFDRIKAQNPELYRQYLGVD